ncbi:hypothetical protein [Georgenia yuyongxinii]
MIDPDLAKEFLARWCADHGQYDELLSTSLPDGGTHQAPGLCPLLQTMSTAACKLVRRTALADRLDIVVEGTMASPTYGERLLLWLAQADYDRLHRVGRDGPQYGRRPSARALVAGPDRRPAA